jgi:hypothetical protein
MQGKSVLTFREAMKAAEAQIEIHCFAPPTKVYARDICRVIAEVYMMPQEASIKIEGEMLPVYTVKEIFCLLDNQHAQYVIEEVREYKGRILSMKAFLRTLLYNAVLSMESRLEKEYEDENEDFINEMPI